VGVAAWSALGLVVAALLAPGLRAVAGPPTPCKTMMLQLASVLIALAAIGCAVAIHDPARAREGEPLFWLEGISGWPSHFLNLLAVVTVIASADYYWHRARDNKATDALWLGQSALPWHPARLHSGGAHGAFGRWRRRTMLGAWRIPAAGESVSFGHLWRRYQQLTQPAPRFVRTGIWTAQMIAAALALFVLITDHYIPEVPVRGAEHRAIVITGLIAAMVLLPALVVAVADGTSATCRLLRALARGRAEYEPEVLERFARQLGPGHAALACERFAADPALRDAPRGGADADDERDEETQSEAQKDKPTGPRHTLLDDWIAIQVAARRTSAVAPLITAPFIVLALLVMARSRLFDNWAMTWPIALVAAGYLLWLVGLAVALKVFAEQLRRNALERMRADLLWLKGCGSECDGLSKQLEGLIAGVQNNETGAFAPMLEQPLVASLMVPLGSAGGVQLLDYLLLAK
jgi:hypothetical protein